MSDKIVNGRLSKLEKKVHAIELEIGKPREQNIESDTEQQQTQDERPEMQLGSPALPHGSPLKVKASKPEAEWYNSRKWWAQRPLIWWKVRAELVAVFFAVAYAVVTFFQWRDANRNFKVDERAWILVDSLEYPGQFIPGQDFPVNALVKNFGRTPALHVHGKLVFSIAGEVCRLNLADNIGDSNEPIGPGQPGHFSGPMVNLDAPCINAIKSGTASLFLTGTFTYKDIFGESHITHYHSKYDPKTHIFHHGDEGDTAD